MEPKTPRRKLRRPEYLLVIDPTVCDGYGYCVELLPSNLSFDDWGYPMIKTRKVDEQDLELAYRAVKLCPKLAFKVNKVKSKDI